MFVRPTTEPRRGAVSNPTGRFERLSLAVDDEVLPASSEGDGGVPTEYYRDTSRSVISRNTSPDIPFAVSLNPYRGCEHGCIYCYARPTHEYLGYSAGLDFETRIFVKEDAVELLEEELSKRSWRPTWLALSGVTDPYQPVERRLQITRRCLELLTSCRQPVGVITKSGLVVRDADLLQELARFRAAHVSLSITTLDENLRRAMEPRAATADVRFDAIARLSQAGVPTGVMVAPVIPGLNDHEIPRILSRAAEAGAQFAGYIVVRLPHAVLPLFEEWLTTQRPERRSRVLARLRDVRAGALSDGQFGSRMRGTGPSADFLERFFRTARERAGIPAAALTASGKHFRSPSRTPSLFDGLHPPVWPIAANDGGGG
ncbi:MAG: PA0069 family radical SAM protein [Vicinamibacterales bacterium]